MTSNGGTNGATEHESMAVKDHLVLTLTREPFHIAIGGAVESDQLALVMLRLAVDEYEARIRIARAQALQQQMLQAAADQAIVESIRKR